MAKSDWGELDRMIRAAGDTPKPRTNGTRGPRRTHSEATKARVMETAAKMRQKRLESHTHGGPLPSALRAEREGL